MAWMNYLVTYLTARESEEGQGMVEYGLIVALVAVIAAVGFAAFGTYLSGFISGLSGEFTQ